MHKIAIAAAALLLVIGSAVAQTPAAPANPAMTGPQLLLQTSMGDMVLQLDNVRSPQSVAHILRLARAGFYNGTAIYRVERNFIIQMGSWGADGKGRGWNPMPVPLEANNGLKNVKFAVALPRRDDPTGAGPDFYINMADNLALDQRPNDPNSGFAVFGEVTPESRAVAQAINDVAVGGNYGPFGASAPQQPIVITRISVVGDPPPPPPPSNPVMTGPQLLLQTSMGNITLQLDGARAPQTVAHILRMARAGHYNGTTIYRVEKNFVIQMGSWLANGEGRGWVPRKIPHEANNGLKNYRLSVALPRGGEPPNGGPDFYINMRDNQELDQKPGDAASGFAVFGKVASGIDVVEAINDVQTGGGRAPFPTANPAKPIVITRISVVGDAARPATATAKPAAPAQARPAAAR